MPVTNVDVNLDSLVMTIVSELSASPQRVWQLWSDPRLLEKWWGPPTFPATFVEHDLVPGGRVWYYMSGPNGERVDGWWTVDVVEEPTHLKFTDGFADHEGSANLEMPVTTTSVRITALDGERSSMRIQTHFASTQQMQQVMDMGMEEGMKAAMNQIDALL